MAEYLSRSFFEQELDRLVEEYAAQSGGQELSVTIMLRDGQGLKQEGKITCTDTYILVDHKGRRGPARMAVPYGSILGVTIAVEESGKMGFKP